MDLPELKDFAKSSNIAAIGHAGTDLFVKFKSGGAVWKYTGVSPELHAEMVGSDSVGSFLQRRIKPNHPGEKVG